MKRLAVVVALLLVPAVASAQNVGKCGWGSKLFDGQRGIAPQVLAVTTNGTSGNQTFAITSGTSGCTQDGVVQSSWKTAAYIDANMNKIARDMSRGYGESLDTLAAVIGVSAEDRDVFASLMKDNFSRIYRSSEVTSVEVGASIREVLAGHQTLNRYAHNV